MRLTETEKRILDGREGPVRQQALELIVRYARVVEAEELCRVTWADLFCGLHQYQSVVGRLDFDAIFSTLSLASERTVHLEAMDPGCVCFSGVEPDSVEQTGQMLLPPEKQAVNAEHLARFVDAGVILAGTCTPYLTGFIPLAGEHFVSCESSAVLFLNSLWAARGNGDGIQTSFASAVCGRTPRWGLHLAANRLGRQVVEVKAEPETIHDWDLLGHTIGLRLPPLAVPVITGVFARPDSIKLKQFMAALACTAGTEMAHLVGLSPEAPSLEAALGGREPEERIAVTAADQRESLDLLNPHRRQKIDYISLGCPHYHIAEIKRAAEFLAGRRVAEGTTLHLWTSGPMKHLADRAGYTQTIERAGAKLLTGSCPSTRGYPQGVTTAAYDSAKQRLSAEQETQAKLFYGSTEVCLKTALTGRWEGED